MTSSVRLLALAIGFAALPAWAGYGPIVTPTATYNGAALSDIQKARVQRAIDKLRAVDPMCAMCLQGMLDTMPKSKICAETQASANGLAAATTNHGPNVTCNDGGDAINVNPDFLDNTVPPGLLKAILAHECCHTKQLAPANAKARAAAEQECYLKEWEITRMNSTDPDLTSGEKDAFIRRLRGLLDVLKDLDPVGHPKREKKLEETLTEEARTPKHGTASGNGAHGARHSIRALRPVLHSDPASNVEGKGLKLKLRRTTSPGGKLLPLNLRVVQGDVLVMGVDRRRTTGIVKALGFTDAVPTGELFELVFPAAHPFAAAWDRAAGRVFTLDTWGNRIFCSEDTGGDGVPDVTREYANAGAFPTLAQALNLGQNLAGGARDLLVGYEDERQTDSYGDGPIPATALYDDDGDCVADRGEAVTLGPVSTTTTSAPPATTSTTTSATTTTTTAPAGCGLDSMTGICGGVCPGSDLCLFDAGLCQCLPPAAACGAQAVAACGAGRCPAAFQQCLPNAGACECQ